MTRPCWAAVTFAYCDENALYAKEYSDANRSRILRLDLTTGEWSALPLNLGEQVLGVNGHRFLTSRLLTDAPLPDYNDREAYNAALQNARSELVLLGPCDHAEGKRSAKWNALTVARSM